MPIISFWRRIRVTKVGIIGCGGIGGYHISSLKRMDDVQIVAACDVEEARAKHVAEKYNGTAYTSYYEMFEKESLDAVFIGVPPYAHTDIELVAAEAGVPFFVQKPMSLSIDTLTAVTELVEKKKLITACGFQDRYLDIVDALKDFIADKKVGVFSAQWLGGIPGVFWWRVKSLSGGQMVEQTVHLFDMARWLFGDVESVYAMGGKGIVKGWPNYDVEDYSACMLKFKSGIVGTIYSGCYLQNGKSGMEVYTDRGFAEYSLRHETRIFEPNQEVKVVPHTENNDFKCIRTFIEAVQTGDGSKIRSPYADGAKSVAIVLAGDQSMESGCPINMETLDCTCC